MLNRVDNFQVYPRGFLGRPIPELAQSAQAVRKSVTAANMAFSISIVNAEQPELAASTALTQAYETMIAKPYSLNAMAYRESFFRELFSIVNTSGFAEWLITQRSSPLFTTLHRDFLEDTVRYIQTGKRRLHPMNWYALFGHVSNEHMHQEIVFDKETVNQALNFKDWPTTVAYWVAHPAGLQDLITTLYILYGPR